MPKDQTIPIRLDSQTVERLDDAARRIGTTRAGIIRFCVETWLRHFEIKGRAALPIDWDELLAAQDGRRTRYALAAPQNTALNDVMPGPAASLDQNVADAVASIPAAEKAAAALPKYPPKRKAALPSGNKS